MGREGGSLGRIEIEIPQCEAGNGKEKEGGGMERKRETIWESESRERKKSPFSVEFRTSKKEERGIQKRGEVGRNFRYFSPSEGGGRCAEETHSPTIMKVGTKTHVFVGEIDKFLSILKFPFASFQGPPF